jgi:hypothetical protein
VAFAEGLIFSNIALTGQFIKPLGKLVLINWICGKKNGNYVKDLFQLKLETTLKARGIEFN